MAVATVAAVIAVTEWHHASEALRDSRAQLVGATLEPIARLLKEDQAIIKELQAEPYTEKDNGILQSYLVKIRRDGVAKTAQMRQQLDQLAENNTALMTLSAAYSPYATTPAFAPEANKFHNYAVAWRDRWNSVMELFMAGGDYPAAGVPFPNGFPEAVQTEVAATRQAYCPETGSELAAGLRSRAIVEAQHSSKSLVAPDRPSKRSALIERTKRVDHPVVRMGALADDIETLRNVPEVLVSRGGPRVDDGNFDALAPMVRWDQIQPHGFLTPSHDLLIREVGKAGAQGLQCDDVGLQRIEQGTAERNSSSRSWALPGLHARTAACRLPAKG